MDDDAWQKRGVGYFPAFLYFQGGHPKERKEGTAIRTPRRFIRRQPQDEHRINENIRAPQVRVIGEEGDKIGVMAVEQAMGLAKEQALDLVEVAPQAEPPVCRVMDYKKFLYEQNRKKKEARKQQRQVEIKEVKLRPAIDEHDFQTKLNHLRKFLTQGNKAKITLMFRRREMRRYEVGIDVVNRMIKEVGDIASEDAGSRSQGRIISVMVSPNKDVMAEAERQFKEELKLKKKEHDRKLAEKHSGDEPEQVPQAEQPAPQG